jgi:hypothetical protein
MHVVNNVVTLWNLLLVGASGAGASAFLALPLEGFFVLNKTNPWQVLLLAGRTKQPWASEETSESLLLGTTAWTIGWSD